MKVKAIKVTAQIQLCCGVASTALGIAAIKLMCEGYVTGTHIWGGLAVSIIGDGKPRFPGNEVPKILFLFVFVFYIGMDMFINKRHIN